MNVNEIETIAEKITIKMIDMYNKNLVNNKSIMDIFNELLSDNMSDKSMEILSYIPSILAKKGYDIINTDPLVLKEY